MSADAHTNKSQVIPYSEYMLTLNGESQLSPAEQSAVDQALMNNSAVGVAMGAYDERFTIAMASDLFIRNLGFTHEEFAQSGAVSLLDYVTDEDRDIFTSPEFAAFEGNFKFRLQGAAGERVYAYAYKTDCLTAAGEKQWVLSVRVNRETKTLHQFMRGLTHLVVRYAICDVEKSAYAFFSCEKNDTDIPLATYSNFCEGMATELNLSDKLDELAEATSPEMLTQQFKANENLYRYDYVSERDNIFYRLSIMPIEQEGGVLRRYLILVMDVTEAHRAEIRTQQALRDAILAANNANEAKTQFLSNMSHDIRTPMNAIIGMTAIATAHIDQPERVLDSLGKITTSSRHLLGLINEVLDMNRIERGKMTLNDEEFSLPELVDNMVEMVRPQIVERHHNFDVRILGIEHEEVIGDSLRVQQVFTNIMSNAVKYTPDGGTITLTISELPTQHKNVGCYEFVVEDNGIGMDEEFKKHLFEPFSRASNAASTGAQGTGLGMPIAKNIVNMMNGEIKVDSELGRGTKVTITIFLRLQENDNSDIVELADLPVLVVDDDELCCESTVDALNSIGMRGESVTNGEDAIARVSERHAKADDFYSVILDWKMPEMDGLECARQIRKVVGPDITIIMLTAYDFVEIEDEARAAGIDYFVAKPLFRSRLKQVFKHISGVVTAADEYDHAAKAASITDAEGDYAGKRFLVVEDNMLNREIMVELVKETGAEIETAENGKIAVDMVAAQPEGYYDLVFMDIQMPVMNGYEATMAIRALPENKGKKLPIIALTANAFAEDVVMAKTAGVNEHVAKPIDINRLNEVMRTWVK